jgi:hypothetical protein
MISSTDGSIHARTLLKSTRDRWISRLDSCDSWYEAFLGLHGVKEDLRRGSKDLFRNIDSEGSIFSRRKKTDEREHERERSSSMLVDKDGDPRPMLVDKDGDLRPMLVEKDGDP